MDRHLLYGLSSHHELNLCPGMKISFTNPCRTVDLRAPRHWRRSGADNGIFGGSPAEREILPAGLCLGMTNEWPPDVADGRQLLLGIYCYGGRIKETDHLFRCNLFRSGKKFLWKTRPSGVNIFGHSFYYFLPLNNFLYAVTNSILFLLTQLLISAHFSVLCNVCSFVTFRNSFCVAGGNIILLYNDRVASKTTATHV